MQRLINDEPHNLFELRYFYQNVIVFRTGSSQFDTLIKHNLIGKNRPYNWKDHRSLALKWNIGCITPNYPCNGNPVIRLARLCNLLSGFLWHFKSWAFQKNCKETFSCHKKFCQEYSWKKLSVKSTNLWKMKNRKETSEKFFLVCSPWC